MNTQQKEKCISIANHYGKESQVLIAIEEMSELTKELCKYYRRYDRRREIIEEISDAEIMLEQLKELFNCESDVSKVIDFKLDRQMRRIEQEES